jgi:hypothetical protein
MSSKEEITSALNEIEIFGSLSGLMLNRKNNTWDVGRKTSILIVMLFMFLLLRSLKVIISTDNMNNKADKGYFVESL